MRRLTDRPSRIDVAARGPGEIRALQRSFNRLVAELNDYRERIANMERANIGRYLTHQFRNSLTPIRLGADQLAEAVPAADTRSISAMLRDEASRMEAILDRFVMLYRFPEPQPAELDIALLVRKLADTYPGVRVAVPATRCWCRQIPPFWSRRWPTWFRMRSTPRPAATTVRSPSRSASGPR